jgi:TolA-binding protein
MHRLQKPWTSPGFFMGGIQMKCLKTVLVVLVTCVLLSCSNGSAQQLLETAQFEEKQHNKEHATKLYQEIVAKHPTSPQAKTAQERLQVLK